MPRFDPDTIAALAEGRLDADEARGLERAIAADAAASTELAAHRAALAATRAAPTPMMSTAERATVRSRVASALGVGTSPVPAARPRRRIPWAAVSVATAAIVAIAALGPLSGLLSTSGDTTSSLGFTAAADAATTTVGGVPVLGPEYSTQPPGTTDLAGAEALPTTTITGDSVRSTATAEDTRARLADAFDKAAQPGAEITAVDETTPCLDEARLALGEGDLFVLSLDDGGPDAAMIIVIYRLAEDGSVQAIVYDPADCAAVFDYP